VQRFQRICLLALALVLIACQSTPSKAPAPTPPVATPVPAPVSLPLPTPKPETIPGAPSTTPPSSGAPAKSPSTTGGSTSPQTSEERRVAEAKRLDESLGTFDATLHKEQSDLAKEREQRTADSAKGAEEKGGEGVEDVKADAGVDPDKEVARNDRHGGMKSDAEGKKGDKGANSNNGADERGNVGEGQVDDIVGRQICEAAQRETDPELKEKLMKECQQYRNGSG
jgi:hypothetical protein